MRLHLALLALGGGFLAILVLVLGEVSAGASPAWGIAAGTPVAVLICLVEHLARSEADRQTELHAAVAEMAALGRRAERDRDRAEWAAGRAAKMRHEFEAVEDDRRSVLELLEYERVQLGVAVERCRRGDRLLALYRARRQAERSNLAAWHEAEAAIVAAEGEAESADARKDA